MSITSTNDTFYYHRDQQGSILALTDSSGLEVENYSYDAYGNTVKTAQQITGNPYAYTGRELDDSDLYYYRARYYDPTIGRFISQDPIGFASGDYNFYRYVQNDPVNAVDPWGLWAFWSGVTGTLASGPASSFSEGAAYDSKSGGYGSYSSTSPDGAGVGSSIGFEFGLYEGTMDGATTTDSFNTPVGSGSIIRGPNGEKGVAFNFSLSWPIKWGYSHTKDRTSFQDLDWAETMWQTYDEDLCDD